MEEKASKGINVEKNRFKKIKNRKNRKEEKTEEERKKGTKRKTPQTAKAHCRGRGF